VESYLSRWFQLLVLAVAVSLFSPWTALGQYGRSGYSRLYTDVKWDGYTFHFFPGNQMAQVLNANNQVIGTILSMNGDLQILPTVTGAEAENLKKSFAAWKAQGGEKSLKNNMPEGANRQFGREGGMSSPGAAARTPPEAGAAPATTAAGAAPATMSAGSYGVLDPIALRKLGPAPAIRLDLNLLRLKPELLSEKPYMRYFIGLNNCANQKVRGMMDNELDYPDLVSFYQPKTTEILDHLGPLSVRRVLYAEAGLWKKDLSLGEYDRAKGAFPILYGGQPVGAEVPATLNFDFGQTVFRSACPVANQVSSEHAHEAMPEFYTVDVQPMTFKEFQIDVAGARRYIENLGNAGRSVIVLVEVHLLDGPPKLKTIGSQVVAVEFPGEVGRVSLAKAVGGEIIGVLYDNHTLPAR
jgi:hypothetical protein